MCSCPFFLPCVSRARSNSNLQPNSGASWCLFPSEHALNGRQLECRHDHARGMRLPASTIALGKNRWRRVSTQQQWAETTRHSMVTRAPNSSQSRSTFQTRVQQPRNRVAFRRDSAPHIATSCRRRGAKIRAKDMEALVGASRNPASTLKVYPASWLGMVMTSFDHGVSMFDRNPDLRPSIVSWLREQSR